MAKPVDTFSLPQTFDRMRQDYNAAKETKYRRQRVGLYGSADSHYANEMQFIRTREYSRDMDRNDAVIPQAINRVTDNQVQQGFIFEPRTGDESIDKDLRQRMDEWANDPDACDIAGERTLQQFEWLGVRHELVDGDVFLLTLKSGHLQAIEAHLCRTPANADRTRVVHGVKLSESQPRRREQFWFCPENINPFDRWAKISEARKVDTRDADGFRQVCQLYRPGRFSQTRGVIWCHAIFDKCTMYEDADFANAVKAQMAACIAWAWEKGPDYAPGYPDSTATGIRGNETQADGSIMPTEQIQPGTVVNPPKGIKLAVVTPQIPTTESMEHMRRMLQIIFVNLGLPLFMGLLDGKEGSFSSLRTIYDQAKLSFQVHQKRRKAQFYVPMTRWKIRQWMAEDRTLARNAAKGGVNIFNHLWNAPGWPYIQPLHDVQADALRLTNLLASPTMLHGEEGRQFMHVARECVRDNGTAIELAIEAAAAINKKAGEKLVTWRDILNRDMPKGDQITLTEKAGGDTGGGGVAGAEGE